MAYISTISCWVIFLGSLKKEKTLLNPLSMFSGMWALITFLADLRLYRLNTASNEMYGYILLGVFFFTIGYLLSGTKRRRLYITWNKRKLFCGSYNIRFKLLYIIGIIIIIYQGKNLLVALQMILGGDSLGTIRALAQDSSSILASNSSGWENFFRIIFVMPFFNVLVFIAGTDFWLGKRDKKLFILSLVLCLISLLSNGGRSSLINFAFSFVISFFLSRRKLNKQIRTREVIKKIRENKRIFALLIGIIIALILVATFSRNEGESAIQLLYYYFAMEPLMLDNWVGIVDSMNIWGYGTASLNGFIFPIIYIIVNVLGLSYPSEWYEVYNLTLLTDSQWTVIAGGRQANAYVTAFWFLYLDARVFGIIFGMLLYGFLMGNSYRKCRRNTEVRNSSIYVALFIGLFYSFARVQFTNVYYALAIIYMLLFAFRKNVLSNES